jgi:LysR family transcriptional activator of nhaA
VLTEAGRITLTHADTIFATGEDLISTLRQRVNTRQQTLRVGSMATLSRNFQLGFLQPVLGRPDVDLVLRSGPLRDLLASLEDHQLDVVLTNVVPMRDSHVPWISHALAEQPVTLVGKQERVGKGASLQDLLAHQPLILPTIESSIRTGVDALLDRMGIKPRIAAEVDDMAMLRLLARENLGLAVVPPIVVKDEIDSGLLVEAVQFPRLTESFHAITLVRRFPNPLLQQLLGEVTKTQ